jgi:hypothetical protein
LISLSLLACLVKDTWYKFVQVTNRCITKNEIK